jgi:hypothetical protein
VCDRCATEHCCAKCGAEWVCSCCGDAETLRRDEHPPKRTTALSTPEKVAFLELHQALHASVDVWIVPRSRWCQLQMARLLLWRRYGLLAALLAGPPPAAYYRVGDARHVDGDVLADHFAELHQAGGWPPGSAPILVTGTVEADLADSRDTLRVMEQAMLLPVGEAARLRPYKPSLSEWMATAAGWRDAVVSDPMTAPPCVLAVRVRDALSAAGLPQQDRLSRLDQPGARGVAFRALYSGSRH